MDDTPAQEAIQVMIDGGERLCDYAMGKWLGGAYGPDEEMRHKNVRRWSAIRREIRTLGRFLKENYREGDDG